MNPKFRLGQLLVMKANLNVVVRPQEIKILNSGIFYKVFYAHPDFEDTPVKDIEESSFHESEFFEFEKYKDMTDLKFIELEEKIKAFEQASIIASEIPE